MFLTRRNEPRGRTKSRRTASVAPVTLGLARRLVAAHSDIGSERITVFSAVERALAEYPTVEAAAAALASARESVQVARASSFPRLDIGGSAIRYQEPMVVTPIHGLDPGPRPELDATLIQTALSARYTLYDAGTRSPTSSSERATPSTTKGRSRRCGSRSPD